MSTEQGSIELRLTVSRRVAQLILDLVAREESPGAVCVNGRVADEVLVQALNTSVILLAISDKSRMVLEREKIQWIGQLVIRTEGEVIKMIGFGHKSLSDLKNALQQRHPDLKLGMHLENWEHPYAPPDP